MPTRTLPRFLGAAAFVLLAAALGCNLPPAAVWVYVDNSGEQPMVVSVDGKEAATIEPGEVATLKYPPGEYRFVVRCGEETICDLPRTLEASDRFGASKYLFDPLKGSRYQIYVAQYGSNRLEGVMEASLLRFQTDPALKRQYIYKQLLKEVTLVPSDAWNDVSEVNYILTPPPEVVYSKGTVRHKVLDRIDDRDYQWLERMAQITEPTDEDIDSLNELIDEILSKAM